MSIQAQHWELGQALGHVLGQMWGGAQVLALDLVMVQGWGKRRARCGAGQRSWCRTW